MSNSNGHGPVVAMSLDDLGEVLIDIVIVRPDGCKLAIPMRTISDQEAEDIRAAMKWPVQPKDFQKGKDGEVKLVPLESGPLYDAYLVAMGQANRHFNRLIMARSLRLHVPGDTDEAKATTLEQKLGAWASHQLIGHVNVLMGIGQPEVEAAAASFPPA